MVEIFGTIISELLLEGRKYECFHKVKKMIALKTHSLEMAFIVNATQNCVSRLLGLFHPKRQFS